MFDSLVKAIFGDSNAKQLKEIQKIVDKINALEPAMQSLSGTNLANKTAEFRLRLKKGETLEDLLPEAFAVVREASKRVTGMRAFSCLAAALQGLVGTCGDSTELSTN